MSPDWAEKPMKGKLCETCRGKGKVPQIQAHPEGRVRCPTCNGTGWHPLVERKLLLSCGSYKFGHEDPDHTGLCIHCGVVLDPTDPDYGKRP